MRPAWLLCVALVACSANKGQSTTGTEPGAETSKTKRVAEVARDGRVTLRAGGASVRFALQTSKPTEMHANGSEVRFPNAAPGGGDVWMHHLPDGIEDFVELRAQPEIPELRWTFETVAGLRLVEDTLELLDVGGAPRLRVNPPNVRDAHGVAHSAKLDVEGCAVDRNPAPPWGRPVVPAAPSCTLVVRWSPQIAAPLVVDPAWVTAASLAGARTGHSAFVLKDVKGNEKVLVAGGERGGTPLKTAEIYDVVTATFAATGSTAVGHAKGAGWSRSNDYALLALGFESAGVAGATVERYAVATGTWTTTLTVAGGPRVSPVMVIGGNVMLVSGFSGADGTTATNVAEAVSYDGATQSALGNTLYKHGGGSGIAATDGFSWFIGGTDALSNERYAPPWAALAARTVSRTDHVAFAYGNGGVIAGGKNASGTALATSDLLGAWYTASWTAGPSMLDARIAPTTLQLPSGRTVVSGGIGSAGTPLSTTEVFDPNEGRFLAFPPMKVGRSGHAVVRLSSGALFAVGGTGAAGELASGEVLDGKDFGVACVLDTDCLSGHCTDHVCCTSACGSTCESCVEPSHFGSCMARVGAPVMPRACVGSGPCAARCDGTDRLGCHPVAAGTACSADGCSGGVETHAGTCDASGACSGATKSCGAYACGATTCNTTCTADGQCATGFTCSSGSCVKGAIVGTACTTDKTCGGLSCVDGVCCGVAICPAGASCALPGSEGFCTKPLGAGCSVAGECASGFCVEGVCCNNACKGTCESCAAPGSVGTCGAAPATRECGTVSTCSGSSIIAYQHCKGTDSTCVDAAPSPCGGGLQCADATKCKTSCASDADCAFPPCNLATHSCTPPVVIVPDAGPETSDGDITDDGGADTGIPTTDASTGDTDGSVVTDGALEPFDGDPAAPELDGAPTVSTTYQRCSNSAQCASGFCVDGVCCDSACDQPCHFCALPSSPGKCTESPIGVDSRNDCGPPANCVATCGPGGRCIGAGHGTQCVPSRCTGPSAGVGPAYCPAAGATCARAEAVPFDCGPYACDTVFGACTSQCTDSTHCAPNYLCDLGTKTCVPIAPPEDSSGCSLPARPTRGGAPWLALAVVAFFAAANRRAR